MSGPAPALSPGTGLGGQAPGGTQRWWAVDQRAAWVAAVQTWPGRLALLSTFVALAMPAGVSWPYVLAAAGHAFFPAWRGGLLLVVAVLGLARSSDRWIDLFAPALGQALPTEQARPWVLVLMLAYLAWAGMSLVWVRRQPDCLLARRPVASQLALALMLAGLASLPAWPVGLRLVLWCWAGLWGAQLWILAYALQDQRSRHAGPMAVQLGLLHPFWRGGVGSLSPTPMGKGAAFLRRHLAKDARELAVTQLKALKLLIWAGVLAALNQSLLALAQALDIPPLGQAFADFAAGRPQTWGRHWAALWVNAASAGLALAIIGHKAVALARLAGFRLPRNTWRPLEATSLAEFWNRYYFYFKELLVDFFFLPTFLKTFRRHPRPRVFFATFMAAGVGNAIYHFLRDIHWVAILGWKAAALGYLGNLVYCAVLALAIGVSQARQAGRPPPRGWFARGRALLGVWTFFVVLQAFGEESRSFSLADRLRFFFSLWGA